MFFFHLAGHSGAGKSRLTAALDHHGIKVPRAVLYTSRAPRDGEDDWKAVAEPYNLAKTALEQVISRIRIDSEPDVPGDA